MRVCAQTRLLLLQPKSISIAQRGVCQALQQHSQALSIPKQSSLYSQGRLDTAHGVCRREQKEVVHAESWQSNLSGWAQPQCIPRLSWELQLPWHRDTRRELHLRVPCGLCSACFLWRLPEFLQGHNRLASSREQLALNRTWHRFLS